MIDSIQPQKESLTRQAADRLEEMIRTREYKPGDKIPNEFELAASMNISRSTVREAIKQLAARNVLEVRRGRGTFVARHPGRVEDPFGLKYDNDKHGLYNDMLSIRLILEPWMAGEAARRATAEDAVKIDKLCTEAEQLIRNEKPHLEKDIEFHTAIAKSTQNRIMPLLIPIISRSVALFGQLTGNKLRVETIEQHRAICDAIARHDAEAAEKIMREHILMNKRAIDKMQFSEE